MKRGCRPRTWQRFGAPVGNPHPPTAPVRPVATRLCCLTRLPQVLGGSEEYAEELGALLWPQLAAAYIAAKLKPISPQTDAEVGALR